MATPIGGLTVFFEDDTSRFQSGMKANAALVEQQSQRIKRSLGGVAGSVDELNRKTRSFEPDAFRALAVSALRAQNNVERLRLSMLAIGALAGGGFAGAFALKTLTDTADRYTNIQNKIAAVVKDSHERVAVESQIFDIAQRTRGSYEAVAQMYQRLTLSASNLGAKQSEILTVVELTTKALQTAGATTGEAQSAATQLSQALGSGRLAGDELRSILENAPVLAQAIAKEFGVSVGALREMGANGELLSERVFRGILNSAQSINEQFAQLRPTVGQAITVLDNAFTRYVGRVDQALGASTALANGIIGLANNFESFGDKVLYAGAGLAAFLVSRKAAGAIQGGIVTPFRAEQARRAESVVDAQGAVDSARGLAQQAATQRKNADFAAREFMNQPAFRQASPQVQAEFERAAATVDKTKRQQIEAEEKHIGLLEKRVAMEQQSAVASTTGASAIDKSRAVTVAREERYNKLLDERVALEARVQAAGASTASRANQQAFYNELAKEITAREKIQALRVERLDLRDAARAARESVAATAGTVDHAAALKQLATVEQRLTDIETRRFQALNDLHKADQAQQKVNAAAAAAQATEQERAANALAQHDARVARAAQATAEAKENEARRVIAASKAVQAEQEKAAAALGRLDQQIISARQGRDTATGAAAAAQRGLATAASAVLPSAAANVAGFQGQRVQAAAAEAEALARATSAQLAYAAAADRSRNISVAFGAALGAVRSGFGSIVSFLGGPLGVALTAVTAGWAFYEIAQARAAQRAEETKKNIQALTGVIDKLNEATKAGIALSGGETLAARARLQQTATGAQEGAGNLGADITQTFGFHPLKSGAAGRAARDAGIDFLAFATSLEGAKGNAEETSKILDQLINALVRFGTLRPDMSVIIQGLIETAKASKEAADRIQEATDALKRNITVGAAKTGRKTVYGGDEDDIAIQINRALEKSRALVDLDPINRILGGPEITKQIEAEIERLKNAVVEAWGGGLEDPALRVLTGVEITDAIKKQVDKAKEALAEAMSAFDQDALTKAAAGAGTTVPKLTSGLKDAESQSKDTDRVIDDLAKTLDRLSTIRPDLQPAINELIRLGNAVSAAIGLATKLAPALDVAQRIAIERAIDDIAQPGAAAVPDIVKSQIRKRLLEGESKKETAASAEKEAQEILTANAGVFNVEEARSLQRELSAQREKESKKASEKETASEKLADRIKRVTEEAKAGFFTPLDKELIEELAKIKGGGDLTKRTREALEAGTTLPKEAEELRTALAVKSAAKEYNEIIEKYGTIQQLLPGVQNEQQKLNLLFEMGKIDSQQYGLALADYLGKFQQFKWIDGLTNSVKNLGDALADAFLKGELRSKTAREAILQFAQSIAKLALQQAAVQPIVNLLKSGLGSLALSFAPGAAGGALSTAPGTIKVGQVHGGGMAGGRPSGFSLVPAGIFDTAERLHSGLRSSEVARVLERDERVLTSRQNRGLEGMIADGGRGGGVVVNNYGTSQVTARQEGGLTIVDVLDMAEARSASRIGKGRGPLAHASQAGRQLRG